MTRAQLELLESLGQVGVEFARTHLARSTTERLEDQLQAVRDEEIHRIAEEVRQVKFGPLA